MSKENGWKLLSASTRFLLPSRWKMLWEYVILGKKIDFTIQAWVELKSKTIEGLKLYVDYGKDKDD